jgi:hypothetical protein
MLQGIRRPRKAERKRIRKQSDGGEAEADGKQRTALERVQEQLGFANEGEGTLEVVVAQLQYDISLSPWRAVCMS